MQLAQSQKRRAASPDVPFSDLATLVSGNKTFAFDLYQALSKGDGNLFYSPYSISLALAMTYAGARGETESQIANTLSFILSQERLHPAINRLDIKLAGRGEGAGGKDGKGFRLNIVNGIWGQEDYSFLGEFLDVLAENYGAGLRLLDFIQAPEESRLAINDWVGEQTEDRVRDLIPTDVIDELTRLVLTNAVYFNAAWAIPFSETATEEGPFHLVDGRETTVPMMGEESRRCYAEGDGYQAVELRYEGRELSMVILLPEAGQFDAFERTLDRDLVDTIVSNLTDRHFLLTLPKFEFESEFSLEDHLAAMGMPVAFTPKADFSGMNGGRDLIVKAVVHKSFVAIDEAGTEAAAATVVVGGLMSLVVRLNVTEVRVDRPFIFFIRDVETGAIIFVGRVLDPTTR